MVIVRHLDYVGKISALLEQENVLYCFMTFACSYLAEQLLHLVDDDTCHLAVEAEVSAVEIVLSFVYHLYHSKHESAHVQFRQ